MFKQKFKVLFFFPFCISLLSFAENYPSRILFVGNSYLYYNDSIHNHVEKMLIEFYGDEEITTKSATIGGSRLHNHNIDHLLDPKNLQLDQQIDLLIMQGGSGEVLTKKSRKKFEDTSYSYSIKAQQKGIKTALYMTHAYTKEDKRYKTDLIDRIKQTYYPAAKRSTSEIIPVGEAYEIAYQKQPNIKLHHPDGTHPGMLGTYLGAATVFAVIAKQSPEGLSYNYLNRVSDEDRIFLQKVAWEAYLQSIRSIKGDN